MKRPFAALALATLLLAWLTTEHLLPWVSWHAEAKAFLAIWMLGLGFLATDLRLQGRSAPAVSIPRMAIVPIAFGLITVAQYVVGSVEFGGDAFVVCCYVLLAVCALSIGYQAARHGPPGAPDGLSEPVEWLGWTLLIGACVSTAIAFAQVFELWIGTGWVVVMPDLRRPGANLAQPNLLATLLLMGAASGLMLYRRGRFGSIGCAILLSFLAVGLAMTESRAGFLGMVALLAWFGAVRRRVFPDVSAWAAAALGCFYLACFLAWPYFLTASGLVAEASSRFGQPGLRLSLWHQLIEAVLQRPWFGWGALGVAEAHNSVAHRAEASNALSYAHNAILDLAVWFGVPLTLAFVFAAVRWAWRRLAAPQSVATWYGLALTMPLAVHSMFEFPYAFADLLVPVALALGFVEGAFGMRPWLHLSARAALAALMVTGAALLWSVVEYIAIEDDFRVVRFEQLNVGRTPPGHVVPDVKLLTQLGALLTGSRIELRAGMPGADLDALRALAMRYPWVAAQFRYAVALALNGQPHEALRQLEVIRAQRGDGLYRRVREQFIELGRTRHPQLLGLKLP